MSRPGSAGLEGDGVGVSSLFFYGGIC